MEKLDYRDLQKKERRIGIRLSLVEKERLDNFCHSRNIKLSDLVRHSLRNILKSGK